MSEYWAWAYYEKRVSALRFLFRKFSENTIIMVVENAMHGERTANTHATAAAAGIH